MCRGAQLPDVSLSRDRDLTWRMVAALAFVLAADALFVGLVVALVAPWLGPLVGEFVDAAGLPAAVASAWWVPVSVVVLAVCLWVQVRYVRHETVASTDARRVTAADRPDLHGRLTRLASQTDRPVPHLYVVDSPVPNSFALDGGGPPVVAVSEGLLADVSDDELDAVLAHELAHVANRDATVMTLASVLPALTSDRHAPLASVGTPATRRAAVAGVLVALYAVGAVATGRGLFDPGYALEFLLGLVVVVVVGGIALGVFATLSAVAARRLSRYREFAADRGAARLTGDPAALAGALERLAEDAPGTPETDMRRAYTGLHGLCLLPHGFAPRDAATDSGTGLFGTDWVHGAGDGTGADGDTGAGGAGPAPRPGDGNANGDGEFHVETRSHPPTAERIARLRSTVGE